MELFNHKEKKERTPQQKMKRGMFALAGILLALVFVFYTRKEKSNELDLPPEEVEMNQALDSLLSLSHPDGYEIIEKGQLETAQFEPKCKKEEDNLLFIEQMINTLSGVLSGNTLNKSQAEEISRKIDGLKEEAKQVKDEIDKFYSENKYAILFNVRKIKLKDSENRTFIGYQKNIQGNQTFEYETEVNDDKTKEEALKELEINDNQ